MNAKLSGRQEKAAVLVAEDRFSDEAIAEQVGVTRGALARWKRQPDFIARVREIGVDLAALAQRRGIARKDRRLAVLQETRNRLLRVIDERAADPDMAEIPGGKTGLIVREPVVSAGEFIAYKYAVDTGTIRELRAVLEQAAKELGQLVEKHEHRVIRSLEDLTDDELDAITAGESLPMGLPQDEGSTFASLGEGESPRVNSGPGHRSVTAGGVRLSPFTETSAEKWP